MAVVEKGDWISISPTAGEDTVIKWQQNLTDHSKAFKVMPFTVKDKAASGTLFLESSYADTLMKACEKDTSDNPFSSSSNYKIQVSEDFQYGQDSAEDTKVRFLVYHDKNDNQYQHRFLSTTAFGSVMNKVVKTVDDVPMASAISDVVNKIADMGKAYIGDPLRNF